MMGRLTSREELARLRRELGESRRAARITFSVCAGTGCVASGAREVLAAFEAEVARRGLGCEVTTKGTGCPGFCEQGPLVVVHPGETCYVRVTAQDVAEIVAATVDRGEVVERLTFVHAETGARVATEREIPFYARQERRLIGENTFIDSRSIDDYLARGGYAALEKALFELTPEEVIEEVSRSGLRGRGGAGFPTGAKWRGSRAAEGDRKYVIVNADEGDPGAFMDRAVLEGNPHSVLEGLVIGAYAVGAGEGFVYVRQEYPLAVENVTRAIGQARDLGLLGADILGSGFSFDVEVHRGAGAFVCGESTALMTALEGRVGEPRPKYVRSNIKGLWNQPTVLNNVETWANVPLVVSRGAEWFASIGTAGSKGTKIFSLVGKIRHTGLVEVPMGIRLREIVYEIGGGVPGGRRLKAVQTGGPSGGCIPESLLDEPVGFDELTAIGSMMGSGGMIVMDDETCMVDVARYFTAFLADESCGKCLPCREGLRQMNRILTDICAGRGREGDIERLEDLSEAAVEASLCALGKSAPNPFSSTLKYFRSEYEAHILERKCPALSCKALVSYFIDPAACRGCLVCLKRCPEGAIAGSKREVHVIDQKKCTRCGVCRDVCPKKFAAVRKVAGVIGSDGARSAT
jgi:NADH-quinone oxidoreductase subunit F